MKKKKPKHLRFGFSQLFKTQPAMVTEPPACPAGLSAWLAPVFDGFDKTNSLNGSTGRNPTWMVSLLPCC